ncbi:unnamed protein product [Prunus armeniaca]
MSNTCILSTGTRKYLNAIGNGETGQPLVQSKRAGNWEQGKWPTTYAFKSGKWLGKSWSNNCVLSTSTCKYLKAIGNGETFEPPGEIIVVHLCTKHGYMQISKGNKERGNWPTTYAIKSGRYKQIYKGKWLGKSWSNNCVLSTGTNKYLKATGNEEIGQPPVQSNQAGGWGNHGQTTNYALSIGTRKYLKAIGNRETS